MTPDLKFLTSAERLNGHAKKFLLHFFIHWYLQSFKFILQ